MKQSTVNDRIRALREKYCDGNNKKFAAAINLPESYVSSIINGKANAGPQTILKILETFPDVDKEWLTNGNPDETAVSGQTVDIVELYKQRLRDKDILIDTLRHTIAKLEETNQEQRKWLTLMTEKLSK